MDVSGLGRCQPGLLAEAGGWCNYRQGEEHIMTMSLALVFTCTFDEPWLRARIVTRCRVACWMLRRRERRSMATPSAIDLEFVDPDNGGVEPTLYRCIVAIIHNGDGMGKRVGHPFVCKDKPGCHRPRFDACSTFWVAEPECQTFRPCPGFPLRRCTWLYGSSKSCVVREAVPVVLPSVSFPWYP